MISCKYYRWSKVEGEGQFGIDTCTVLNVFSDNLHLADKHFGHALTAQATYARQLDLAVTASIGRSLPGQSYEG